MRASGFVAGALALVVAGSVGSGQAGFGQRWAGDVGAEQAGEHDDGVVRAQEIVFPVNELERAARGRGGTIVLRLFEDAVFACRVTHAENRRDGVSVRGTIEGEDFGFFTLTMENGRMCGSVFSERGTFGIEPTREGGARAVERRGSGVVECAIGGARESRRAGRGENGDRRGQRQGTRGEGAGGHAIGEGRSRSARSGCGCDDDPSFVNVLVVYTTLAKNAAGGSAALQARVQNGLDTMNLALDNSLVTDLTVTMAGFVEVSYDESSPEWLDHLERVTEPADGFLDGVHALRDAYKADAVMLIVDDARFTGGGAWWAIWDEGLAFSCLNWRACGSGSLTLAHELGHNFGCAHDYEHDPSAPYSYCRGHYYTSGANTYGTIMSYVGTVVPYFSNPFVTGPGGQALGKPPGDARAAYNALIIDQSRWTLANCRGSGRLLDVNNNGVDDAVDLALGTSEDINGNCRPDDGEARAYVDINSTPEGSGSSWTDARRNLEETLRVAGLRCSGIGQVWVADGTYRPDSGSGDRWARYALAPHLGLYGGFQGRSRPGGGETSIGQRSPGAFPSILSGDIGVVNAAGDNAYTVVEAVDVEGAVLDMFTVERGNSFADAGGLYCLRAGITVRSSTFRDHVASGSGSAIVAYESGAVVIEDCAFLNNTGHFAGTVGIASGSFADLRGCVFQGNQTQYGGGLWINSGSAAAVVDTDFVSNTATGGSGGADVYDNSVAFFDRCEFVSNHALAGYSGALGCGELSSVSMLRCVLEGNDALWAGGAMAVSDSTLTMHGCRVVGNIADSGGGLSLWNSAAVLSSSLLAGNAASGYGGAMLVENATQLTLSACTLADNAAGWTGGGISSADSTTAVGGCVLWGNSDGFSDTQGEQLYRWSGTLSLNRSCVMGLNGSLGGTGNISLDPRFVDSGAGDYSLQLSSPCIDAGSNVLLASDTLDMDADGDVSEAAPFDLVGGQRFVDAPTADTGVSGFGHDQVSDMGAFESGAGACRADYNQDGSMDAFDYDDFVSAYFNFVLFGVGFPDYNTDGSVDAFDYDDFASEFFSGCG